jgi:two-component system sensor histidine kinase GlrK
MKRYPHSFLQLVTWGHLLVMLPLLAAGLYVFVALDNLNSRYQSAIEQVSVSARLSGELAEDLVHMERNLRRYEILKDEHSLDDYMQVRNEWRESVATFLKLPPLPEGIVAEFKAQLLKEDAAFAELRNGGNPRPLHLTIEGIQKRSPALLDEARQALDQEQAKYVSESETLRTRLIAAAVTASLTAFCCLWLIRRLLARLIGRFERAVLSLGKGDLQQQIALDGPGDLRWLGRWLEWLRRRLLSLEESRTRVLRHVSHELKTPLAAMHEGASLLAEQVAGPLTPEQSRIVQIMQGNSRRLQDLIDGLLRLQQAEHSAERIGHERLRFDKLIEQVGDTYRLIAQERAIRTACNLQETEIVAGREALMTIIHNLLSNAVKYSPDGGEIRVTLTHDGQQAVFDVQDQGPGIGTEEAVLIFEPFYRSKRSRQVSGVGLGLAIAREFVLALRGTIELVPAETGAHFRVVLPLNAPYLRTQPNV